MTVPLLQRRFVDKLNARNKAFWGERAAILYPFAEKLSKVKQPLLAIGPKDNLWDISPRIEEYITNGSFERWPNHGFGIFYVAKEKIIAKIRSHLG